MTDQPPRAGFSLRFWMALFPALIVPLGAALFYFVIFSESRLVQALYGLTKAFLVGWPLVAMGWILGRPVGWREIWPARLGKAAPWGVGSGMVIVLLMVGLDATPVGEVVRGSGVAIQGKVEAMGILEWYWVFGLFLALLHSFLEEYYWRWFVYGRLREVWPGWRAHLLAGLAFSAHHIVIATQYFPAGWGWFFGAMTGVGGVLWSWLYERQRTLAGAWVSHILVDLGLLAYGHKLLFGTWW